MEIDTRPFRARIDGTLKKRSELEMQAWVGTSGFSYKEWKGEFYPQKIADREMLSHYASRLNSVELNNTFYRMPQPAVIERWGASVPADFRFAIKAPRRITHVKRLQGVEDSVSYLAQNLDVLKKRCGVLLFQFPPFFRKNMESVESFLGECWPKQQKSWHLAFEFRHPSWFDGEVEELLARSGAALCVSDTDEKPSALPKAEVPFAYLRLRKEDYPPAELDRWAAELRQRGFEHVYVYFKHEVHGPRFAEQLAARLGGVKTA
jgi:uncharacterized protein YecE (DUF72 family)